METKKMFAGNGHNTPGETKPNAPRTPENTENTRLMHAHLRIIVHSQIDF